MLWSADARNQAPRRARHAERPVVTRSTGAISLRDPALFADPAGAACRSFLQRVFRVAEVVAVEIDRSRGIARITHDSHGSPQTVTLERIAGELRAAGGECGPSISALPPRDGSWTHVRVVRGGPSLTTWEVVHTAPGRVRFRNEVLRADGAFGDRVARELSAVHGVAACHVRRLTAGLLVRFDPSVLDARRLARILDQLLEGTADPRGFADDPAPVPFALANATVGLAAVGELALPALLPVSAVLLIGSNLPTLRAAVDELRGRKLGLPLLSATIVVATLSSGGFLAAALMAWMVKFWHRQHRGRLLETRRRLLPGIAQHHRLARLATPEPTEVLVEDLRPGDVVRVAAGESIPTDGLVVGGWALVDEGLLHGRQGLSRKTPGSRAFAGSCVREGEIQVAAERVGNATRAAVFARALAGTAVPSRSRSRSAVTAHGEDFAERTVVPTLATAGLGLLVGDLTTAAALLRPDYATGPGLGVALELLEDSAECARRGIVLRDPTALRRFAETDLILFDDHAGLLRAPLEVALVRANSPHDVDLTLRAAATALRGLADERLAAVTAACASRGLTPLGGHAEYRVEAVVIRTDHTDLNVADTGGNSRAGASLALTDGERLIGQVDFRRSPRPHVCSAVVNLRRDATVGTGLLSRRPPREALSLAEHLGVGGVHADLSIHAKIELLRSFRARGLKVAVVGDWQLQPDVAREAHVALSTASELASETDPAGIVLVGDGVGMLEWLREYARSHVTRVRTVHGATLVPNLLCVAGAFFLGFTSLASVIVTNLGTLSVYSRWPQRAKSRARRVRAAARDSAGGALRYNRESVRQEANSS